MITNKLATWVYTLIVLFVFAFACFGYDTQTDNLLNQNFNTNSWSGTNKTTRHGNNTIAGVDGKYVESTISLADVLTQEQLQGGFKSTLGADIWFWYTSDQSVVMKQTIGNHTQTRTVEGTCATFNGCSYATYTDEIIINANSDTNFDTTVRFEFNEDSHSAYHRAADLKNPTLQVNYWNSPVSDEVIDEVEEVIEEFVEWEEQFVEPIIEPPSPPIPPTYIEEIDELDELFLEEPLPTEMLDESFEELEEQFEETEILQLFELPMAEDVVEDEVNIEEVATEEELSFEEEMFEEPAEEVFEEASEQVVMEEEIVEEEVVEEEVATEDSEIAEEETTVVAKEEVATEEGEEISTVEEPAETVAEQEVEIKQDFSVDVADVEAKVKEKIASIDKQLQVISVISAKAMTKTEANISSYTTKNANLFDNRQIYENKTYKDVLLLDEYMFDIYSDDNRFAQISGNDPVLKYQTELQDARIKRIQAEYELRKVRGY